MTLIIAPPFIRCLFLLKQTGLLPIDIKSEDDSLVEVFRNGCGYVSLQYAGSVLIIGLSSCVSKFLLCVSELCWDNVNILVTIC